MPQMHLEDRLIVFDLDGTLVDTAPDLHRALNEILISEKLPEVSMDQVRMIVGHGARALIQKGAALSNRSYDDARLDLLTQEFIKIYAEDIAARSNVFPGVIQSLDTMEALGARFCVCTNKKTDLAIQLLDTLNLSYRFASIIGADSVANRKPHAEHYLHAVAQANGDVTRSMMVGDSASDSGAARAAGAPVVLVSFGYTDIPAETLEPDALISHFDQLPDHAVRLLS